MQISNIKLNNKKEQLLVGKLESGKVYQLIRADPVSSGYNLQKSIGHLFCTTYCEIIGEVRIIQLSNPSINYMINRHSENYAFEELPKRTEITLIV
jgi:hypothetical protein